LQLSNDQTRIYALTGDGLFSAWSLVQTSQKLFSFQLEDPYFKETDAYKRSFWYFLSNILPYFYYHTVTFKKIYTFFKYIVRPLGRPGGMV
jgi:hypothetical protein